MMMPLSRQDFENREVATLAPYAVHSGTSRGRTHAEPEHAFRTVYQRDRDQIGRASCRERV